MGPATEIKEEITPFGGSGNWVNDDIPFWDHKGQFVLF